MERRTGARPGRIMWLAVAAGFFADTLISAIIRAIGAQFDPDLGREIVLASSAGKVTAALLVFSTGIGGWLAGRLARHENVLHGTLVGGIGIIYMLVISFLGAPIGLPEIVLQCVAVVTGAVGGWLSRWIPAPQQQ